MNDYDNLTSSDSDSSDDYCPVEGKELPIFKHEQEIIESLESHQIIIIHGQTGCGKTTQIPQFLYKREYENCIGITQPRRIAAISMAKRVAKELRCRIGTEVGYEIRFEKKAGSKIKYMTDGILLNECMSDRMLGDYSVIMVDEAHERSLVSDVLLGILKTICKSRPDLKLIVSSATINVDKFSKYLQGAKVIPIEGRLFNVQIIHDPSLTDLIKASVKTAENISKRSEEGDVLIFLPGQDDINECCNMLDRNSRLYPIPLYSAIDFYSQKDVFKPAPKNKRKVVVATNIAETSITIDNIRFVIDCGYVKQNNFLRNRGIEILESVKISKSQAIQRQGRAGRTSNGWCYRLYTEERFNSFDNEMKPEIFRKSLAEICLKLYSLGADPKTFDFIDKPNEEELTRCEAELTELGLMENVKLTDLGRKLSNLPLEPILGVVIYNSKENGCMNDVIKIISMLSERHIFKSPRNREREARNRRRDFESPDGDHFMCLNVFMKFNEIRSEERKQWCYDHFIDFSVMSNVLKINRQISEILEKKHLISSGCDGGRTGIMKTFVNAYYRNICIKGDRESYFRLYDKQTFLIHPSSCLRSVQPKIILFNDAMKTTKTFMHGVMRLDEDFLRNNFKDLLDKINFPADVDNFSTLSFAEFNS